VRIDNQTDLPRSDLERMVAFVQGLLPKTAAARFAFLPREEGGTKTTGQAEDDEPQPFPCLVTVWVTAPGVRLFPAREQYVPFLPPVLLRSHEEEVMLVLAHEMRHVHQFMSHAEYVNHQHIQLEEDAEEFAYQALFLWRQRRPDRRCRTGSRS
jgi:hypothetical protein